MQLELFIQVLWHSGPAGTLSSFNFDGMARNQYGRNLKYSICIERPNDDCEVRQKLVQKAGQASFKIRMPFDTWNTHYVQPMLL